MRVSLTSSCRYFPFRTPPITPYYCYSPQAAWALRSCYAPRKSWEYSSPCKRAVKYPFFDSFSNPSFTPQSAMTSFMSKRQQARNERALQDLIWNVPGNDRCADCGAKNPGAATQSPLLLLICIGWASWSVCEESLQTTLTWPAGDIPLHAMRCFTPKAGNPHFQGQVLEHGHVV